MTRLALALIAAATPRPDRESVAGDTIERFDELRATAGPSAARRWLWREVARVLRDAPRHRVATHDGTRQAPRARKVPLMSSLGQDVRYALRSFKRSPGFTAVAVATLALGIGANTAMFSVIHAALLRPLPYPQPSELIRVGQRTTGSSLAVVEFEIVRRESRAFSSIAAYRGAGDRRLDVAGGPPEWIAALAVTTDFLRTLGVPPALGRELTAGEVQAGGPQAVVLSHAVWREHFGADPEILGRLVALDDVRHVVVGVLPADFWFPQRVDALVPLRSSGALGDLGMNTSTVARLANGVTLTQADGELAGFAEELRRARSGSVEEAYQGVAPVPLHRWVVGDQRATLVLLFGATAFVLLIACANLAVLLLARASARDQEIALRLALGGSRRRLAAQFLVESACVSVLGAGAGLLIARGVLQVVTTRLSLTLPSAAGVRLDGTVLAFALGAAMVTAVVFTLVPLLTSTRLPPHDSLKVGGRMAGAGRTRARARSALVAAQVALAVTLLIGAALLIQSLHRLRQEPLGFSTEGLVTFTTPIDRTRLSSAHVDVFVEAVGDRLRRIPGVRDVATTNLVPLAGQSNMPAQRDRRPEHSIGGMEIRVVSPNYFDVLGIPVRRGRAFAASDAAGAPAVAIVNDTVAAAWWQDADPIGDGVAIGLFRGKSLVRDAATRRVVGVGGDTKAMRLDAPPRPTIFIPLAQADAFGSSNLTWILRTEDAPGLAAQVRRAVEDAAPGQRVGTLRSMDDVVGSQLSDRRLNASLFAIFAGVSLLLVTIGLYGVVAYAVAQRTREIGVRMALGARPADVLATVLRQSLAITAAGLAIGVAGAAWLAQSLQGMLFNLSPLDPSTFIAVPLLFAVVALVAALVPARRATRVDPLIALRVD